MSKPSVTIREVGPRDGLQMARSIMSTSDKLAWIAAMHRAGVAEMEVTSFVPPALLPQMADAAALTHAVRAAHPGLRVVALAPNLRGARDAQGSGADRIVMPVSSSQAHSRSNLNRTREQQVAEVARVVEWARGLGAGAPMIEAGISTAFGCSLQGEVPVGDVVALAAALVAAGVDLVSLADTLGYATPSHIRRVLRAVRAEIGAARIGQLHLHDTLGTALANVTVALEEGQRRFDSALAGLGGCPFAPGSVGNVCTEDLVFLLESEGFDTGIDLGALIASREILAAGLPDEPRHGRLAAAGIPKTFHRPAAPAVASGDSPLSGIRVVEFSHMVMGPSCGMILGDLGADVIKVEPAPLGDNTRRLRGSAIGFFPSFNRNKRSLCVDMKSPAGLALVRGLIGRADVVVENFRPGAMGKLGLGPAAMREANPRLIYLSCKGFLPGPYEHRAALDEVVQMMGGLAVMTGPPGRPMRAGTSINDIMGGAMAAIGILGALRERDRTGLGSEVQAGLFETNAMLVAQHMAAFAITGEDTLSFGDPQTLKPWSVYEIFDTSEPGGQVFVGAVTDTQWRDLCAALGFVDLLADPALATQSLRTIDRGRYLPRFTARFATMTKAAIIALCERLGLPYAPINFPSDMLTDPHLLASGGLLQTEMAGAESSPKGGPCMPRAPLPALPVLFGSERPGLRRQPPGVGEHSLDIAREAGLEDAAIAAMLRHGTLFAPRKEAVA
jgi:crotonobetainyl-CoA:carnitine CoA-transferase CaiB-like acyl-CoA transferase/isopropylmalate/homocitrate/citramalate synthase